MAAPSQAAVVDLMTDKYEVIRNIGHGSYGIIVMVRRKSDGTILCRKEINYEKMNSKERDQLQTEINVLKTLRHPHIVSFYDTVHLVDTKTLHLYMEYCGGGDLSKVIRDLAAQRSSASEAYIWSMLAQLSGALFRCHYGRDPPECPQDVFEPPKEMGLRKKSSTTILHRDLKPENIFLAEDGSVKLGDFGLSKLICGSEFAQTYVGTPYYMCPELCNGQRYTLKSDIWSVGCILYELCTGMPPFDARTAAELASKIRRGVFTPIGREYSESLRGVINSCLQTDPHKRPATNELLDQPTVRLMRRQFDLKTKEDGAKTLADLAEQKRTEAAQMMIQLQADREKLDKERKALESERKTLDDALRREWEVRANLKIDEVVKERIAQETASLHEKWEIEFPKRVAVEVENQLRLQQLEAQQVARPEVFERSTSPETAPLTSPGDSFQSMATDEFTTDLSSLTMSDSPFRSQPQSTSSRRTSRTAFTRAKTQVEADWQNDVHMIGQSPAVKRLALSPRRKSDSLDDVSKNLFVAGRAAQRWQPTNLSDLAETDGGDNLHHGMLMESEDEFGDLPSPSLVRGHGPFAEQGPRSKRPSLGRQQTAPANRMGGHGSNAMPLLFTKNLKIQDDQSTSSTPTSPTRERRAAGGLKIARTDGAMFRDIVEREASKRAPGRTLHELHRDQVSSAAQHTIVQQPPVVLAPKSTNTAGRERRDTDVSPSKGKTFVGTAHHADLYRDVANWENMDSDEMPSPFKSKSAARKARMPMTGVY